MVKLNIIAYARRFRVRAVIPDWSPLGILVEEMIISHFSLSPSDISFARNETIDRPDQAHANGQRYGRNGTARDEDLGEGRMVVLEGVKEYHS